MFHIILKSTNIEATEPLQVYIDEKIGALEKFLPTSDPAQVEVRVEVERTTDHHRKGDVYRAEVNIHVGGMVFRAESTEEDMRLAIDRVRDELQRQLKDMAEKNRPQDSGTQKELRELRGKV